MQHKILAFLQRIFATVILSGLLFLSIVPAAHAQTIGFPVRETSSFLQAALMSNTTQNVLYVQNDARSTMLGNPSNFAGKVKYKSNQTIVKMAVDHSSITVPAEAYVYKMLYQINGSTRLDDTTYNFTATDSLVIAYNPDSLTSYQDMQIKVYSGLYNAKLTILQIYDMTNGTPSLMAFPPIQKNLFVELAMQYQPYLKTHYVPADMALSSNSSFDATKQVLNVNWSPVTTPFLGKVTPAEYELEWTYCDNYAADGSELAASDVFYNFKNNATRIITDSLNYSIPVVYPKGYIVYRVRMLRVDSNLYQYPVYGLWSLANANGTVNTVNSSAYSYKIVTPHTNDQLNWNYTINFAEGGKYKHVIGYFDGLLKNRQTITRFNSNPNQMLVTENIYDYEGRPEIVTLPSVVNADSFTYTKNVSVSAVTNKPYAPSDFDVIPSTCPDEVIAPSFTKGSLANRYYSDLNTDTAGMQKFVPQAGLYPFVHTRLSPGFSDRVDKQGGAGYSLQIGRGHETEYQYVNADQPDLNGLFGLNVGFKNFYTKTMSKDPNGQLSMLVKDYEGKQIATALVGTSVDTPNIAIMLNDEATSGAKFRSDQLANTTQLVVGNQKKYNGNYFMDMDALVNIKYEYTFQPYTVCPSPYLGLSVKGSFDYKITDDCGVLRLHKLGPLGETGVTTDPTAHPATTSTDTVLNKGKYTIDKTLSIATDDIYAAVDSFFAYKPNCAKTEDDFIRAEVEKTPFPCPDTLDDPCAALAKKMMEELFPGAKYGGYTYNGTVMGTGPSFPSIFDYIKNGDGTGQYRYQSACDSAALNSLVINRFGHVYTMLGQLPVDTFLFLYKNAGQDQYTIARALLPLHPEYCRLLGCFVDTFETRLKAIPDAAAAIKYGLFALDDLVAKDTQLRQKMLAPPISMTHIADSLRLMFGGTMRMDTMASEMAFCMNDDAQIYGDAKLYFHNDIINKNFPSQKVRDIYFDKIRTLYLSNRAKYVSIAKTAGGDNCEPCSAVRMSLIPPPLVPVAYNTNGTFNLGPNGLLSLFSSSLQTSLATLLNTPNSPITDTNVINHLQDSAANMVHHADSLLNYIGVDSVMARMVNCINDPSQQIRLKDSLIALVLRGEVHNGLFLPEQIRWALTSSGIALTDICHPYLYSYDYYSDGLGQKGSCESSDFYNAATAFFNNPTIIGALQGAAASGAAYNTTTSAWDLSNQFSANIATALPGTNNISIRSYYEPANKVFRMSFYRNGNPDSVIISLRSPVNVSVNGTTYNLFQNYSSIHFDNVSCYFEDPQASADGHVGRFMFRASVTRTDGLAGNQVQTTKANLMGWNNGKIYMNEVGGNEIANCVSPTEFRKCFYDFMTEIGHYNNNGIMNADYIFFFMSMRNFMNYNLKKVFSEDQYRRFLNSCQIDRDNDGNVMYDNGGYASLSILPADFETFRQNLIQSDSIDLKPKFEVVYPWSPLATIFLDYKGVPFSKVKTVNDKIFALGGQVNTQVSGGDALFFPSNLNVDSVFSNTNCSYSQPITVSVIKNNIPYSYSLTAVQANTQFGFSDLQKKLIDQNIQAYLFPSVYLATNEDYFKPEKQALLNYAYSMYPLSASKILDTLQDFFIHNNIPAFNNSAVSYKNPTNPNRFTDLYYNDPTSLFPGYNTMQQILTWVKSTLGSSKIFIPTTTNTYTVTNNVPNGASLKLYRCGDGLYWYRYFDANSKLYNFYVRIPSYIYQSSQPSFNVVGLVPDNGDSATRRFTIALTLPSQPTDTVYAQGSTDFDIAWSKKLSDVLLGNEDNTVPSDPVSGEIGASNNCEQQLLQNAIYVGKIKYLNYIDSFKTALKAAFYAHVMNQVNEKLWIEYIDARFALTLYNYDLAGNLIQTVPPMGVHKLDTAAANTVDQLRLANQYAANAIPQHTKVTRYEYNTANKPTIEVTPDAGQKTLSYDAKGNVIMSQSEKQRKLGLFTYMLYDGQNRVVETGEVLWNNGPNCAPFADKPLYQKVNGVWQKTTAPNACACENLTDSLWQYCAPDYSSVYDNGNFAKTIRQKARSQVVETVYDNEFVNLGTVPGMSRQQNLRSRIAASLYFESCAPDLNGAPPTAGYVSASHYSYDAAGNVQTVTQEIPDLTGMNQRYKRIDYEYDLLSGKVNMVSYNRGKSDQFFHRYTYDADNRITKAETSHDGFIWKRDAEYAYYQHGPLARTSLGNLRVQGVDYAYTIQGWLKAINADRNDVTLDMGKDDGVINVTSPDVYSTTVNYFNGDYTSVGKTPFAQSQPITKNLYNGNIAAQTNDVAPFGPLSTNYTYDQLNRIRAAKYGTMNADVITFNSWYASAYKYDLDGNIQKLVRYENTGKPMDSMSYAYQNANNNKLSDVLDYANFNQAGVEDIKPYTATGLSRFLYDENGNVIKDLTSNTDTVQWNIYGKTTDLTNKTKGLSLHFLYDAKGDRIAKKQTTATDTGSFERNTYYVRDASGNIMAEYNAERTWSLPQKPVLVKAIRDQVGLTYPPFATNGWISGLQSLNYLVAPEFVSYVTSLSGKDLTYPAGYYYVNDQGLIQKMLNAPDAVTNMNKYSRETNDFPMADAMSYAIWDLGQLDRIDNVSYPVFHNPDVKTLNHVTDQVRQTLPQFVETFSNDYKIAPTDPKFADVMLEVVQDNPDYYITWLRNNTFNGNVDVVTPWLQQVLSDDTYLNWFTESGYISIFQDMLLQHGDEAANKKAMALSVDKSTVGIYGFASWWPAAMDLVPENEKQTLNYYDDPVAYLSVLSQTHDLSFTDEAVSLIPSLDFVSLARVFNINLNDLPIFASNGQPQLKKQTIYLSAHHMYGSSRLGITQYWPQQYASTWDFANNITDTFGLNIQVPWYSYIYNGVIQPGQVSPYGNGLLATATAQHILGQKQYELTNHLGNVQATVSDKRYEKDANHDTRRDAFKAGIQTAYDYYPFGMLMPGRFTQDTATRCMIVNQTKMVPVYTYTYPDWAHSVSHTGNVAYTVSGDLLTFTTVSDDAQIMLPVTATPAVSNTLSFSVRDFNATPFRASLTEFQDGQEVELASQVIDHVGNYAFDFTPKTSEITTKLVKTVFGNPNVTLSVINWNVKKLTYQPQNVYVQICNNGTDKYEFGYNGKYKDNDIAGTGNSMDFGARMYNPRLARFNSMDPYAGIISFQSPYLFANNSPVTEIDKNGQFGVAVTVQARKEGTTDVKLENFNRVVANIGKIIEANPAILNKMVEQTGIPKAEIIRWMNYGEGPTIYILGANEAGTGFSGARGDRYNIYFSSTLVNDLASYREGDPLYEAALFATGMTILHEATHTGDARTNGHVTTGSDNDLGIQNSKSKFGHRGLDVENAIIGANQPILSSDKKPDGSFTENKGGLRRLMERFAPTWKNVQTKEPSAYRKIYGRALESFKNDNPAPNKTVTVDHIQYKEH